EPLARLHEADLIVVNGDLSPCLSSMLTGAWTERMALEGALFRRVGAPQENCGVEDFAGRRVHAIAGIGRPERFFEQLRRMGLDVVPHAFPDHHAFVAADLAF